MKVTFRGLQRDDWAFIRSRISVSPAPDSVAVVAVDGDGATQAICLMDTFTPRAVQVHLIIENPMVLRHGFLEECFGFVFEDVGLDLMLGFVPSDRPKALRFNKHIGFTETYRIKDVYTKGVDSVIMELRRDECKYLANSEVA